MKNVKRVISLTLLFVFALAAMAFAYIGNARSGIFHYAVDAGYRPCRVCRP